MSGVDVNPDMVGAAREHLPFADGGFDLVFLGVVLHETDAPPKVLQEARRVARLSVVVLEWPYRLTWPAPLQSLSPGRDPIAGQTGGSGGHSRREPKEHGAVPAEVGRVGRLTAGHVRPAD